MKRSRLLISTTLLAWVIVGCDSGGIKEGQPTEPTPATGQTDSFRAQMERDSKNMQLKKQGRPATKPQ